MLEIKNEIWKQSHIRGISVSNQGRVRREKITHRPFMERLNRRKPILQLDNNGVLIQEWDSATSFGKHIGKDVSGNIIACIKGQQKSAYGYKWKYKYEQ